ncbi:hypothetical protein GEMRC1_009439 [Eukaryota sp. GEM-RC1]
MALDLPQLYSSSDSDDGFFLQPRPSFRSEGIRHYQFAEELPPVQVDVFSLSTSHEAVSEKTAILRRHISPQFPFIAISFCEELNALLISTPARVLVIYIDAPLHTDLRDLLMSPDVTKVHTSDEHILQLNQLLHDEVLPVVTLQDYFNQIGSIFIRRVGKKHPYKQHPLDVFAAHGFTPIPYSSLTCHVIK